MSDAAQSLSVSIEVGEQTLVEQALLNADVMCAELDEAMLEDAAHKGAVWVQIRHTDTVSSRPVRMRDLRSCSDKAADLLININCRVLAEQPLTATLKREEKNYSIWHKPSGMLCQGTRWADHCSLVRGVELAMARPVHLVHRLDKAASGLIVLAHTRPAAKALSALFAQRKVRKIYTASGNGRVDWSLPHVLDDPIDGKSAKTIVLAADVLATNADKTGDSSTSNDSSRLSVQIETGRKHQIRQHLAAAGFPIVGDRLFDPNREHELDLQLSATELGFQCPFSGDEILVHCD